MNWQGSHFQSKPTHSFFDPYSPFNNINLSTTPSLIVDTCTMGFNADPDKSIDVPLTFKSATIEKINNNKNIIKGMINTHGPTEFYINGGTLELNTPTAVINHWSKYTQVYGIGTLRFAPGVKVVVDNE